MIYSTFKTILRFQYLYFLSKFSFYALSCLFAFLAALAINVIMDISHPIG